VGILRKKKYVQSPSTFEKIPKRKNKTYHKKKGICKGCGKVFYSNYSETYFCKDCSKSK